jgi:hypothetical protein
MTIPWGTIVSGNPSEAHTDNSATLYHSYLVRLWRSTEQASWRASAQSVQTGNTVHFGDVDSLLTFLQTEISGKPGEGEADIR